jgi:LPXTG-site transpeptidase (sortase) family protein
MSVMGKANARRAIPGAGQERVNPWPVVLGIVLVLLGTFGIAPELSALVMPPQEIEPSADLEAGFAPLLAPLDESLPASSVALPQTESRRGMRVDQGEVPVAGSDLGAESPTVSGGNEGSESPPAVIGYVPQRLVIPSIGVDAPIIPVSNVEVEVQSHMYRQWEAPDSDAVGWHENSARIGVPGNTVFNGHHNIYGEVFRHLSELEAGDLIFVSVGVETRAYQVAAKMILKERFEPLERRLENARWIQATQDERLTLITCWPYTSNTHRVVVVATPVDPEAYNRIGAPQSN